MKTINQVSEVKLTYKSRVKASERKQVKESKEAVNIFRSLEHYNDNIELFECFYAMYLNRNNKVLSVIMISEGGTTGTVIDIKKIAAPAILQNASACIISHNHPSGNLQPSKEDKTTTDKIKNGLLLIDVILLDHIIISEEGFYSFADNGLIF